MPMIKMENGRLLKGNRPARWCQWTLTVADLDPKAPKDTILALPGAMGGLPAGHEITSEEQLFKSFDVPVSADAELRAPNGKKAKLQVKLRARRADDFTGPGLRIREPDQNTGEVNELHRAQQLISNLLDQMSRDRAARVDDAEKKKQREKLAQALRALASSL